MAATSPLPHARFGRIGHQSTRVVFGAAALGSVTQEVADEVLEVLLEFGVNHLDTAAGYGDSELRIAPWLARHRDEFFLATKTGERDGAKARAELEKSLTRLGVDHVDLIQLHNLVEPDEWDEAHAPGGVVEALEQARAEGLVRFIGVTGHGLRIPEMHLRSLERFDYDSVLFPYNHTLLEIPDYRASIERLIALCHERDVATLTIKSIARARWREDDDRPRRSWYEPLENAGAIARGVQFVLARPGLFLASSSDYTLLRTILEAASQPISSPSEDELAGDEGAFAITALFDGDELERI
jgi:aryl-alcohol dehydrogenase-like predicted oxidoreductase